MKFKSLPAAVLSVAWRTDGKQLIAGCADGRVRIIDPDSLDVLADPKLLDGWVYTLAVPARGREVLAGGEKGRLARAALPR
jgi:WD40 repeat protein